MADEMTLAEIREYTVVEDKTRSPYPYRLDRYGEPAGVAMPDPHAALRALKEIGATTTDTVAKALARQALTPHPGQCDLSHINLWRQIEVLTDQLTQKEQQINGLDEVAELVASKHDNVLRGNQMPVDGQTLSSLVITTEISGQAMRLVAWDAMTGVGRAVTRWASDGAAMRSEMSNWVKHNFTRQE
jgi:hypothetical protein